MVQLNNCTKEHVLSVPLTKVATSTNLGQEIVQGSSGESSYDVAAEIDRRAWPYGQ
jgi:hypothetical protein